MNEKFFELPEEKHLRIINAGFEVFAQYEYKKASTEDIAAKAGISKGLLFYYFHNKKSLYLFLFDYADRLLTASVIDERFREITDPFELFEYAAVKKYEVLQKTPYVTDFIMRSFFSKKEPVSDALNERVGTKMAEIYDMMNTNLDFSKARDDVDMPEILRMLTWTADGYIHERQRAGPVGYR